MHCSGYIRYEKNQSDDKSDGICVKSTGSFDVMSESLIQIRYNKNRIEEVFMKCDMHVHTLYSDDSKTPMESVIISAIEKGFQLIAFTDHVDYGVKIDWDHPGTTARLVDGLPLYNVNYEAYFKEITELQKKYKNQIQIKTGLELGVQRHTIDQFKQLCDRYPLDFAICSIHQVNDLEFWTQDFQRGKTQKEYIEAYYDELLYVVEHFDQYSVLGHLDLIVRYDLQGEYPFELLKEKLTKILTLVIQKGKGIEVNTSSFKYGLKDLTPSKDILKLYYDLGGRIITIGSDSHVVDTLGSHFDDVILVLKEIGFDELVYFEKMKPVFYKI